MASDSWAPTSNWNKGEHTRGVLCTPLRTPSPDGWKFGRHSKGCVRMKLVPNAITWLPHKLGAVCSCGHIWRSQQWMFAGDEDPFFFTYRLPQTMHMLCNLCNGMHAGVSICGAICSWPSVLRPQSDHVCMACFMAG